MKRYGLIGLFGLLVAVTVWAAIIEVPEAPARMTAVMSGGGGGAGAPDGPNTWYGPTVTGTSYSGTGAALCEMITVVVAGSLTQVSAHVSDKGSANIKIALYNADGTALLSSGGAIANASVVNAAWNDIVLGTPVAVTASQVVMVCFEPSADMEYYKDDAVTDLGRWASVDYATFPAATITDEDADAHIGVRCYVD